MKKEVDSPNRLLKEGTTNKLFRLPSSYQEEGLGMEFL